LKKYHNNNHSLWLLASRTGPILAIFLTFLLAAPLWAQDELSTQLDMIMVTSTRAERELKEIPLSVSVIGEQEINDQPRQDAADYIRTMPGVQVTYMPNGQAFYSIRGFGTERVLLLVDGVKQKIASTLNASEVGGVNLDPSEIERIEVIKGPASALYGTDAIGGVVNIITRKQVNKPFGFDLGLTFDGSTTGFSERVSLYGSHKGFYWRVSGRHTKNEDLKLPNGVTFYNSDNTKNYYSIKTGYEWENGDIDLSFSRYENERNTGAYIYGLNRWLQISPQFMADNGIPYSRVPKDDTQQIGASLNIYNISDYLERLHLNFYITEGSITHSNFYASIADFLYDGSFITSGTYNEAGSSPMAISDYSKGYGGTLQADFNLPGHNRLNLGIDFEHSRVHSLAYYGGSYLLYGYNDEDRRGQGTTFAVFLQDEWRPIDKLMITLGLRYSHTENKVTEYVNFPDRVGSATHSNVVGSLGVVFDATDNLTLRALYSQGFRAPTLNSQLMGPFQYFMINPDLEPEKSNNYELGVRYFSDSLNIDLALFHSDLKDAFYQHNTGIPMLGTYFNYQQIRNADKAKATGAELAISYEFLNIGLTPYLTLTTMRYERQYRTGVKTINTGVPHTWGVGGFKYSHQFNSFVRLFGDASLTWSGRFYDDAGGNVTGYTMLYGQGLRGDVTFGIEAGQEHKYQAILSFRNIGDTDFQTWGWYQPGFHVVASLGFEF
jgi:hemoglobin/transferrin/lactoferrin receptor protein